MTDWLDDWSIQNNERPLWFDQQTTNSRWHWHISIWSDLWDNCVSDDWPIDLTHRSIIWNRRCFINLNEVTVSSLMSCLTDQQSCLLNGSWEHNVKSDRLFIAHRVTFRGWHDWSIDYVSGCLIDWLVCGWLFAWLVVCLINCLADAYLLGGHDWLIHRLIDRCMVESKGC